MIDRSRDRHGVAPGGSTSDKRSLPARAAQLLVALTPPALGLSFAVQLYLGEIGLPAENVRGCSVRAAVQAEDGVKPNFTILAVGDFGTDKEEHRNRDVAAALHSYLDAEKVHPDAALLLGDNFYDQGLVGAKMRCMPWNRSTDETEIRAQAEAVVRPFEFLRERTTTYVLPGNHDYECTRLGSLENQRNIDRWLPPEAHWGERWKLVDGGPHEVLRTPLVQVIAIDSELMIEDSELRESSARRLEQLLAAADSRWRIVAGHHPLYSNGHHDGAWWTGTVLKTIYYPSHFLIVPPLLFGNEGNYEWKYRAYIRRLEEVFARHPVHLVLGGHEHNLQLLKPSAPGQPHTAVSGSAARCENLRARDNTIFAANKSGFAVVSGNDSHLTIDFVGTTGCEQTERCARPTSGVRPTLLFRERIGR